MRVKEKSVTDITVEKLSEQNLIVQVLNCKNLFLKVIEIN